MGEPQTTQNKKNKKGEILHVEENTLALWHVHTSLETEMFQLSVWRRVWFLLLAYVYQYFMLQPICIFLANYTLLHKENLKKLCSHYISFN